ncbi:hypothetical protein BDAP_000864 [Binucleata daphniae]
MEEYYIKDMDLLCGDLHCLRSKEFKINQFFPGTNRVIFLSQITPIEYLSLNHDQILVVMRELTIPPNENFGSNCTIAVASEEKGGYYIIMADKRLCGDGPYRNVRACNNSYDYPRNAIWYIKAVNTGFHISRGDMCITKMSDEIGFKQKEEYAIQLRKCSRSDPAQVWNFDHVDNFYQ